jgi:hypothetical protein
VRLVDPLDHEGRILLLEPVETGHQLVLVAFRFRPDGDGESQGLRRRGWYEQ